MAAVETGSGALWEQLKQLIPQVALACALEHTHCIAYDQARRQHWL